MIKFSVDEARRILTLTFVGTILEAEIDGVLDALQERYPEIGARILGGTVGKVAVLLDWERLEGWEMGAKTAAALGGKMLSDTIDRVALVTDARWYDEKERIADTNKQAEVRTFAVDRRDEAVAWLSGK
jgi:hypothetical protein